VTVRVVRFTEADAFRDSVLPFLLRDEARHSLMLGIITTLVERPFIYDRKFLGSVEADGRTVGAVLTTPPYNAVVSDFATVEPEAMGPIADAVTAALLDEYSDLSGVTANLPVARAVRDAWTRRTGAGARRQTALGVFSTTRVVPPPGVPGRLRNATDADHELVLDWYTAFGHEAHQQAPTDVVARQLEARLRGEGGGIDLWEVAGSPVSLTGYGSYTPHGARIAPVYTPRGHRGRGYASALVAATTQRLLDEGRTFCFLSTDLANPTANHIYQAIGYEQVCVAEDWRFERARGN
jgi:GNAT superfamily N-acetyltransferase